MNDHVQVAEGVWLGMDGVLYVDEDFLPDCVKRTELTSTKTCISCGAKANHNGTLPCDH
jgi:hypothetical protein